MTGFRLFLLTFIFLCTSALAQTGLSPFPSSLTAILDEETVFLRWQDVPDFSGVYRLYRHTVEISEKNFPEASFIIELKPGMQSYRDLPEKDGEYYYALLAVENDGTVHETFIPYRNKTTLGLVVRIPEKSIPAEIAAISGAASPNGILLSFEVVGQASELIVYRSTEPMFEMSDLVKAVLIDTIDINSRTYADTPIEGVGYYYGVFNADLLRTGGAPFETGQNILQEPVTVPLSRSTSVKTEVPSNRRQPLPFLTLTTKVESGERLKGFQNDFSQESKKLQPETEQIVDAIKLKKTGNSAQTPVILPADGESDMENAQLVTILEGTFAGGEWRQSLDGLNALLIIKRSREIQSRVHFYIGQCYFFLGEFRQSFLEFLFAEDRYYTQVQPWLDRLYKLL